MLRYLRLHFLRYDVVVVASALLLILLWPRLLQNLFNSDYMPHGGCYLWTPSLVWLHVGSDTVIGLSYVAISVTLAYLVHRARKDIPFSWMFLAFGLFIITCGATHLMAVWTVWNATYWLAGGVKIVTGVASLATAVALPPLVPKVRGLIRAEKVSEERRLELEAANRELGTLYDKLQELDRLKSDFFANVSHELRTPLSLILGPADRIRSAPGVGEPVKEDVALIERNARSLLEMVDALLALAKLDADKLELAPAEVDLARLVRLTAGNFEVLAEERGVDLQVDAPSNLQATVDPEKIQRVVLNLVSNALKHTPAGGVVRVTLAPEGNAVRLAVDDTGPGVPPEMREAIFERFRQAPTGGENSAGGTGLGLAIAREMVELHGGSIEVGESAAGGARFEVELPRHTAEPSTEATEGPVDDRPEADLPASAAAPEEPLAPPAEAPAAAVAAAPPADAWAEANEVEAPEGAPVALVVEDNPEMIRFLRQSLSGSYRVVTAGDGREALAKAAAAIPDIVVTDLMMPRMDGAELVQRMRSRPELETVPVVVLTAKADERVEIDLLRSGAHDYLTKPFTVDELRTRMDNLVQVKRTRELLQAALESREEDLAELAARLAEQSRDLERRNRELDAARVEAEEANRLKDDFLAVVSHELRTPLNAIVGWAAVLRERPAEVELVERGAAALTRNAQAQVAIVDDLLDVSRIVSERLELDVQPLRLDRVVEDAVDSVRHAAEVKDLGIRLDLEADAGTVEGDPARLLQVVSNLLSNAIKFTPEGGGDVEVRLARGDSSVELTVRDRGEGIGEEFLPRIFDRFSQADASPTRRQQGLGLGLAIVRHLVELHGGTVEAESAGPGEGSTFTVRLPAVRG